MTNKCTIISRNTSHYSTYTQTQYFSGQHDSSTNIQTVYTATTQTA